MVLLKSFKYEQQKSTFMKANKQTKKATIITTKLNEKHFCWQSIESNSIKISYQIKLTSRITITKVLAGNIFAQPINQPVMFNRIFRMLINFHYYSVLLHKSGPKISRFEKLLLRFNDCE